MRRPSTRVVWSWSVVAVLWGAAAAPVPAGLTFVTGGQTSVALDARALSTVNLTVSGVSGGTTAPGALPGSVGFPIQPRTAAARPTTFRYDPANFGGTFAGTIEHDGSVLFNAGAIEVGDLSIRYDPARAGTLGGDASGFYVVSTAGVTATLFDVAAPSTLTPAADGLGLDADLLVSPEFADLINTAGLSTADATGADVGDVRVSAQATAVPLPPAAWAGLLTLGGMAAVQYRRRRAAVA